MFNTLQFNNGIGSNRNLIAWWKLETNLKDFSGHGYNLTVNTGSVPFTSIAGKQCAGTFTAGNLAAPSAFRTAIDALDTRTLTIEMEVYTDPTLAVSQEIIDFRSAVVNMILDIRTVAGGGAPGQSAYLAPPSVVIKNTNVLPTNSWTNLTYASNGSNTYLTQNLTSPVSTTVLPNIGTPCTVCLIGNDAAGSLAYPFRGYLRNIKVWQTYLTKPFPTITT